ncbi:HEAT repeat domain-containing protein [Allokutzneria sp. NRRL B-24872]|uniref:HEAT repeat domain-containing protein n=1 Tax=Allokutzneria sp. NRRL B-24872 TaxID=1137961 RepID=UPI000A3A3FF0|nr:HEAT repeat domain-containing protein [Allokutzneria sp. NRRL B-24872]
MPSLLLALDNDVDAWRAVQVTGKMTAAADRLVPMLGRRLADVELTDPRWESTASTILRSLAELGDPAALPVLTTTLGSAVRQGVSSTTRAALAAVSAFGPDAASTVDTIRSLTTDDQVRSSAIAALWAIGRDHTDVVPLLHDLLRQGNTAEMMDAANVLSEIGPPATAVVPRLRDLLTHDYEWVRVHAASALWAIAGEESVLDTLLQAWALNPATGNFVVTCLDRMGPAAAPALPELLAQLALPRRGGRYGGIVDDEQLQRTGREVVARFA